MTERWLDLDFADLGWRRRDWFRYQLDTTRLQQLFAFARQGLRLYELAALRRPADVGAYVDVRPLNLPAELRERWQQATRFQGLLGDRRLSLEAFDALIHPDWEDRPSADMAWASSKHRDHVRAPLNDLLHQARALVEAIEREGDLLVQHELQQMRQGRHAFDALPLPRVRQELAHLELPEPDRYTASFYAVMERLLRRPEVEAIAYRDHGDYRILRSLCREQRRRANALGCAPAQALHLSSLTNVKIHNDAWGSELRQHDEGIGWADLYIDGDGDLGAPLWTLQGSPWQHFGRWVLSTRLDPDLLGYAIERGEGWTLYEAAPGTPIPRPPRERW